MYAEIIIRTMHLQLSFVGLVEMRRMNSVCLYSVKYSLTVAVSEYTVQAMEYFTNAESPWNKVTIYFEM